MFQDKISHAEPKNDEADVNMVLAIKRKSHNPRLAIKYINVILINITLVWIKVQDMKMVKWNLVEDI